MGNRQSHDTASSTVLLRVSRRFLLRRIVETRPRVGCATHKNAYFLALILGMTMPEPISVRERRRPFLLSEIRGTLFKAPVAACSPRYTGTRGKQQQQDIFKRWIMANARVEWHREMTVENNSEIRRSSVMAKHEKATGTKSLKHPANAERSMELSSAILFWYVEEESISEV